jgi:hypothetical protein
MSTLPWWKEWMKLSTPTQFIYHDTARLLYLSALSQLSRPFVKPDAISDHQFDSAKILHQAMCLTRHEKDVFDLWDQPHDLIKRRFKDWNTLTWAKLNRNWCWIRGKHEGTEWSEVQWDNDISESIQATEFLHY